MEGWLGNSKQGSNRSKNSIWELEHKLELLEPRFTDPVNAYPSSEATLMPLQSPRKSNTGSQLSFGLGLATTPSLSAHSNSRSQQPQSTKPMNPTASFSALKAAADRHMQRVGACAPQVFNLPDLNGSRSSSLPAYTTGTRTTVVKESPPIKGGDDENQVVKSNASTATGNSDVIAKKRKSIPTKREEPSVKENLGNAKAEPGASAVLGKRGRSSDTAKPSTSGQTEPNKKVSKLIPKQSTSTSPDNNSREETGAVRKKDLNMRRNTAITNFFSTASNAMPKISSMQMEVTQISHSKPHIEPSSIPPDKMQVELDQLKKRCLELQQICDDKDEQLRAVANNRTIQHTGLQKALSLRNKELSDLLQAKADMEAKYISTVEHFVRLNIDRESKELLARLAADGARVGRIVYTRTGMRTTEGWEDGYASKELKLKQGALLKKREELEKRFQQATIEAQRIEETGVVAGSESVATQDPEQKVEGLHIRGKLEAIEALESLKFHLDTLRRQEKELAQEEKALNDEKTKHIMSLKRVASEEASRFRLRPKLHDRYILLSLLGKGGFSEVWSAFDLQEMKEVAVKIHQLDPRWPENKKENYTKHISREYEIHRSVRHPRIVSLFDVFEIDNNSFATVLECCTGKDLDLMLKERRRLPERDARAILLQILSGMKYLSSSDGSRQGIIHYDLKPANILFDEFGDAKITDFGLSKILDSHDAAESMELTSQGAGTYWYLPPECFILEEGVRISNKVDVWSIGVIFYQMLFGKRPFGDGLSQDFMLSDKTMLNARQVPFPDSPIISEECKEFVQACLTYDQEFRPTIQQVCEHSYILVKQF